MKHLILLILTAVIPLGMTAKSMHEILVSMPDSIAPYLTHDMRKELADKWLEQDKAEVTNLLEETSVIDTLTNDYAAIRLNAAVYLQMKRLPTLSGDSVICLSKTYCSPEGESEVKLFGQNWTLQGTVDVAELAKGMISKPDSITQDRYESLKAALDPVMAEATLSPDDNTLSLKLSTPLMSREEKNDVKAIISQRKFKWNGHSFK